MFWAMWTFMLVWNLLDPGMLIYYGRKYINDPPRMNDIRGYHTSRALKSRDAWDFAQQCLGKVWMNAGIAMVCLAILIQIMLPCLKNIEAVIWSWFGIFCAELATNMVTFVVVEVKLRQNFDENGNRR